MKQVYGVRKSKYESDIIMVMDDYEDAKCLAMAMVPEDDAETLIVTLLYAGNNTPNVNQGYQTVYRAEEWMED